nr:hypothetical protein Ade03nite_67590 [Actinoplanes derwentensis]
MLLVLAGLGAVIALRGRLPDPGETLAVLGAVDGWWAAAAVVAALGSQLAFADQQRRLLAGFGVRVPAGRVIAMTLGRSAMSMTLPAGSAVSAAFAFRIYRRYGAATSVAVTVTAVSGLLSMVALALLYLAGWLVSTPAAVPWAILGAAAVLPLLFWGRGLLAKVPRQVWTGGLGAAVVNWALDMFCLVAAAAACQVTLGWWELALIYLAVQVVRQVPLTPGGVGLIEASMLAGLIAAGMPEVTAAAVVLLYRLVSFWMILPMGLAGWLAIRDRKPEVRTEA